MNSISSTFFIKALTGKIYKILPLKESEQSGQQVFISKYLENLIIEMTGACSTFSTLRENIDYISVLNTIQYLFHYEFSVETCKREVFKMLNLLNKIERELGGDFIE